MPTDTPKVSFVVPCYQLGHLLRDCVDSILCQTYEAFEVLIMDDCSPDNTPQIAAAFNDPRVLHVRNQENIGHLANYNKGIGLARGDYIWLISADDKLLKPYVLQRFVDVLRRQTDVGFVFCPAVRFTGAAELGVQGLHGDVDAIWSRGDFLRLTLVSGNSVPAPSGLVRRQCYERVGRFPLDLPFAGDWYMWSAFALHFDVAYLAEPMVGRRDHASNMTKWFEQRGHLLVADEFEVLWRVLGLVESVSERELAATVTKALADLYGFRVAERTSDSPIGMTLEDFERSVDRHRKSGTLARSIRSVVYARLADSHREAGRSSVARLWLRKSLRQRPSNLRTAIKLVLLHLGPIGKRLLHLLSRSSRTSAKKALA
jgi:glycosyltransferase involved in cell wall biosynthesis